MTDNSLSIAPDRAPGKRSARVVLSRLAGSPAAFWILSGAICLLALGLRLPTLATRSLWLDEAYSAWFSALPLGELWSDVPLYETHPPLYYTLLKGWTSIFGTSEAALRGPSVIASVATVFLVSLSGRISCGDKDGDHAALFGALLLAVNEGSIFYAQEARPYPFESLAVLAAILSAARLLQILQFENTADKRFNWLPSASGLSLAGGLALWTHNTAVFVAFGIWAGLAMAFLICVPVNHVRNLMVAGCTGLVALLIWSPFLPFFLMQSENIGSMTFWVEASKSDFWSAWYLAAGNASFVPVMAAAIIGLATIWRKNPATGLTFAIILLLPLYTVVGISHTVKPIYISRLFEWMAPPLAGLAGWGIFMSVSSRALRIMLAGAAIGLSLASATPVSGYGDWRIYVETIAGQMKPGDIVIASPTECDPGLRYYAAKVPSFPEIRVIPGDFPYRVPGRTYVSNLGAPRIEPADAKIVKDAINGYRRVWLLEHREELYDPQQIVRREILRTRKEIASYGDDSATVTLFE